MDISLTCFVSLHISDPPDLTITYNNGSYNQTSHKLTCNAHGNPDQYTFYIWQHKTLSGQLIRTLTGLSINNTSVLTLRDLGLDLNYQNSGYYVCRASNGIPNRSSDKVFSREVYYDIAGNNDKHYKYG